jgi:hypothetical protein
MILVGLDVYAHVQSTHAIGLNMFLLIRGNDTVCVQNRIFVKSSEPMCNSNPSLYKHGLCNSQSTRRVVLYYACVCECIVYVVDAYACACTYVCMCVSVCMCGVCTCVFCFLRVMRVCLCSVCMLGIHVKPRRGNYPLIVQIGYMRKYCWILPSVVKFICLKLLTISHSFLFLFMRRVYCPGADWTLSRFSQKCFDIVTSGPYSSIHHGCRFLASWENGAGWEMEFTQKCTVGESYVPSRRSQTPGCIA